MHIYLLKRSREVTKRRKKQIMSVAGFTFKNEVFFSATFYSRNMLVIGRILIVNLCLHNSFENGEFSTFSSTLVFS